MSQADLLAVVRLVQSGEVDGAGRLARTLTEAHPNDPRAWLELARCLLMAGRGAEALVAIGRLEAVAPAEPGAWSMLGGLYSAADEPDRARPFFERAARAVPDNPRFIYDLAASQRMTGAIEAGLETIGRAIALDPTNTEALWIRSDLRQATREANNIDDLEHRLLTPLDSQREVFARYALAREYEEVGEWERAFANLERGAALQKRFRSYDVRRDVGALDTLREAHTREAVAAATPGCQDARPIFIVGLPRTGTTLAERVLSSHPQIHPIGESSAFDRALIDLAVSQGLSADERMLARSGLQLPMDALGRAYLADAGRRAPAGLRFTDKQPRNSLNVGLIRAALPNARIILIDRHPMDACWAMHKTLFLGGAYPFTVDLMDLAAYYAAWRRMADHWVTAFGEAVIRVRYEDMVAELACQTRRMLDLCGLDWSEDCLAFHSSGRPSSTASAVQVRRPLYATSIGLWRRHAARLAPLAERLQALGVDLA